MDISFLPELDVMSSLYSERFAVFKAFTDQKTKILEWISDRFDEEITSQLVGTETEDGKVALSVLGIGSGDGKMEIKMLMQLRKKFHLIECTVVEPSGEQIKSYKKLVEEQKDALNGVTFNWRQESFQEFCKANVDSSKTFNFVSAIHSCHYIPRKDLVFYFDAITSLTAGKILIMQGADTTLFSRLEKEFPSNLHAIRPFILGKDIVHSLKTLGVKFENYVLPSECDITSCFENDSRDGKLLLDFFLNVVGCIDDGPPQLLKMIKKYIHTEGISYTRNGRLYSPVPTEVITASISKKSQVPTYN